MVDDSLTIRQGMKNLLEEDYEAAVVAFMKVIETDPRCADAYLKVADAYVGLDDYDSAIDQLEAGYGITGDERLKTGRAGPERKYGGRMDGSCAGADGSDSAWDSGRNDRVCAGPG